MTGALTLYGFPAWLQTRSLFYFAGAGFLAGVVYDLLRFVRLALSPGRFALRIFDGAFVLLFGALIFCTSMAVCYGELHFFMLLSALAGFLVYYAALDGLVRRISDPVVRGLRRAGRLVFRVFSLPARFFVFVFGLFGKIFSFPLKKIIFFLNKVLQNVKRIMYNNSKVPPNISAKRKFGKMQRRTETAPDEKK